MRLFATVLALSVLGSYGGLLAGSLLLLLNDGVRHRLLPWLISYAVGTLLGVALLALLPDTLAALAPRAALGTLVAGILSFFVLEKLVLWRHCHTADCDVHEGAAASLVLLGGAFHNFADGVIIAAAAISSVPLGLSTALAVAAHTVPQEIGDYAVLLSAGHGRRKALGLNALSSAPSLAGAAATFAAAASLPALVPYVLAFAAGAFLYVAMADLIPGLHRGAIDAGAFRQILFISAGIATILAL